MDWLATLIMFLLIPALSLPLFAASAAGPDLTASPGKAGAGTKIKVAGSDFPEDVSIVLAWDDDMIEMPDLLASDGSFEVTFAIPANSAPGKHTLTASGALDPGAGRATEIASTSVVIAADQPPAAPTPAPTAAAVPTAPPVTPGPPTPTPNPTAVAPTTEPTARPPTPTPTATPAPTPTATATPTPTPTVVPTATPTATPAPTQVPTPVLTPTPTATLAPTPPPTATPAPTPVPTPIATPTPPPAAAPVPPATACRDAVWFSQYYNEMTLSPKLLKKARCETKISENWGLGRPGFGLRPNWFSVRWTKRATFKAAMYTFKYSADNGMRFYIDGSLVLDRWGSGGSGTVTRAMTAGRHLVKVEYFENAGSAQVSFSYKKTGQAAPPVALPPPPPPPGPPPGSAPSATPPASAPTGAPAPTATPAPTPVPTPAPGLPGQVSCSTPLSTLINNAAAGSTLNLGSCVYTSGIDIRKSIRLYGGTYRLPAGATAVHVNADAVTIEGARFEGGGNTVQVYGRDRTKILNSTFSGMSETSIRVNGPSADDVLIAGNTITQRVNTGHGYSPIAGQGYGRGKNNRLIIRNNTIDQGPSGVAWFGVEVWDNVGLVIEGNLLKGSGALVSIPRSDGAIVRNNQFDMTQAYWGIELADVDDAQVYGNNVWGNSGGIGPDGRAFVQMHPGSGTVLRNVVRNNTVRKYWALVNAAGSGHTITNNCLNEVTKVNAYTFTGPVTVSGNGPC